MADGSETREPKTRGEMVWHSSEEGGGPDVGIHIALGGGASLWMGEISRHMWEQAGAEALGGDGGWWLVLYKGAEQLVLAKCVDSAEARDAADLIAAALRGPAQ